LLCRHCPPQLFCFFVFVSTAPPTALISPLSLHDALPISSTSAAHSTRRGLWSVMTGSLRGRGCQCARPRGSLGHLASVVQHVDQVVADDQRDPLVAECVPPGGPAVPVGPELERHRVAAHAPDEHDGAHGGG